MGMRTGAEGLNLIKAFEGDPRLEARLCEGNRWELGYGCTFWPDNRPVREGQTITREQVDPLLVHALKVFEEVVNRLVTVEINQYQFDALVSLVYNIGEENFSESTVLRMTNQRRFEDAADGFRLWTKATSEKDANGNHWLSPDGKPCKYRRALRGLLRRHYAEACVYSGLDWEEACADDAIAMRSQKVWEPDYGRWHDRILWDQTTPIAQVLAAAKKHPLPSLPSVPAPRPEAKVTVVTDIIKADEPIIKPAPPIVEPPKVVVAKAPPPPPSPPVAVAPPPLPKDAPPANIADPKDMVLSRRFWGLLVTGIGTTNLLPDAAESWVNNEGNRELLTWLVVVVVGFCIYKYGQHKASRPLK